MVPAPTVNLASKQLDSILAGNIIHIIKDEPRDHLQQEDDMARPPRKRQRLDHLSMEEKIMRRKLKNRVAAQTARDRKKQRMDQLEAEIDELKDLTTALSDQNSHLAEENAMLKEMLAKCTCGKGSVESSLEAVEISCDESQSADVSEGIVIPVSTSTGGSAVSQPQQKAVGMLAVLRLMVLSTLCSQWVNTASLAVLINRSLPSAPVSSTESKVKPMLPVKKRTAAKWWGPHQQSWNPTGM